jgi:hypothetical protein
MTGEMNDRRHEECSGRCECLYDQRAEAEASPGSLVSSLRTWEEISLSPRTKIIFALEQRPAGVKRKVLKIAGKAWMSGAATGYVRADVEWRGSSRCMRVVPVTASCEEEGDVAVVFDLDEVCMDNGVASIPGDAVVKVAICVAALSISLTGVKAVVCGTSVLAD